MEINDEMAVKQAWESLRSMQHDILSNFSKIMQLNYFTGIIGKMLAKGRTEADVNWDFINSVLKDTKEDDFNNFKLPIKSYDELMQIRNDCISASLFDCMPWRKSVCKDCGKEFTISHNEVNFFINRDLSIPKRCTKCRERRKVNNG